MTLTIIYHPPYNTSTHVTNANFIDDFLTDLLSNNSNNVVVGDFNLHVNDPSDNDANIFTDTTLGLGLHQHIEFATQKDGNTLDLLLIEIEGKVDILTSAPEAFISDHRG